ncbi:MAG TPA: folylpolyglutamate synthase/dihydrofolate synthase family protein [Phycisphaerae bacterium]|nr:folylpolyglutamate synthase/dihydrofolate synthase family protein [Phycisphaerae bacterium]HRW52840.1 folylpolyglutamate synthase/dihydrofolate synthase family protein [Phycisphaerae bacterium]
MSKTKTKAKSKVSDRSKRSSSPKSGPAKKTTRKKSPAKSRTSATTRVTKVEKPKTPRGAKLSDRIAAISEGRNIRTYTAAMDYLSLQTNYERRPPRRHQRGVYTLERMKRLLADLGNPQDRFKAIHVAGSKGKGSTVTMLAEMLINNGMKVGVYTSPHVMDLRERIVIDHDMVSKPKLAKLIARIAEVSAGYEDQKPTYFEILTACALLWFAEEGVDIAVVETGLGGRFDATNLVNPVACAITSISIDHVPQLGDTVEKIAEEKAGILKPGVPVISAPQEPGVKKVLKRVAQENECGLAFAGDDIRFSYRFEASREAGPQARICVTTPTSHFDHLLVPLVGEHQAVNCGVAIGVLDRLKQLGYAIDDEKAVSGLTNVRMLGRMEMICEAPRVIGDGAHNAASIEALMRAIGQNVPYDSMVVIFGCCGDKDIDGMLRLIQLGADKVIFTKVSSPRSADPAELAQRFAEVSGRMAQVAPTLASAFEIAEKAVTREDLICVTGSFYLVADAKRLFADHPHRSMSTLVQTA